MNTAAAIADLDLASKVRDVTREEVEFYTEHGWVMLRELISRDLAAELLAAAKEVLPPPKEGSGNRHLQPLSVDGYEPFRSFAFSEELAKNANKLINRGRISHIEVPIQFHSDRKAHV